MLAAAAGAGLDPEALPAGLADDAVKQAVERDGGGAGAGRVRRADGAVSDELFWGDDRLEEAAAALEVATG